MRKQPDVKVLNWLHTQVASELYLSALTVAEIRRGLALLPKGRRQSSLMDAFQSFLAKGFDHRILAFTQETSLVYAPIYCARVKAGLSVGELDVLIAAIAKEHGARLATRNTKDFDACGLRLINPWLS